MTCRMDDHAVSPVIGVMLMIVVTVIVAAVVSAFAGGYVSSDKKAPAAVLSCKVVTTSNPPSLVFTHQSGDYFNLAATYLVISSGESTRSFDYTNLNKIGQKQGGYTVFTTDREINTGNQFSLGAANNGGVSNLPGAYLGWTNPDLYLTENQPATFTLVDRESGQTISAGRIVYDG